MLHVMDIDKLHIQITLVFNGWHARASTVIDLYPRMETKIIHFNNTKHKLNFSLRKSEVHDPKLLDNPLDKPRQNVRRGGLLA